MDSDDRFRGRSVNDGKPVGTLDLSFDGRSGAYLGGALDVTLATDARGGLVSSDAYAGYAKRLSARTSVDIGLVETYYTRRYAGNRAEGFAEGYIGLAHGDWSAHLRYSPSYVGGGHPVIYAELDTSREILPKWHLSTHAGLLAQTAGTPPLGGGRSHYDFRVGIARLLGRTELRTSFVLGGPSGGFYYAGPWRGRAALVAGVSRSF